MRRMISLILTLALLCALPLGGSAEERVQRIRPVTQSPCHLHVGDTITLEYRIEPESLQGAPLTWHSSDERVATVAEGVVTCVGAGKCSITASPEGPANSVSWQIHVAEHFLWDGELTQTVPIPGTDLTLCLPEGWREAPEIRDGYVMYGNNMTGITVFAREYAPGYGVNADDVRSTYVNRYGVSPEEIRTYGVVALPEDVRALLFQFSVTDTGNRMQVCISDAFFFRGYTLVEMRLLPYNPTLYQQNVSPWGTLTDDAGDVVYADFLAILETLSAGE